MLADKADAMDADDEDQPEAVSTTSGAIRIKAQDATAAGSTSEFLNSKLVFKTDDRGQEICVVKAGDDEVGVMMGWETDISEPQV